MEITLGEKIKINGEEVPEYLLKALYEHLKLRYPVVPTGYINCASREVDKFQSNGSQIKGASIKTSRSSIPPEQYITR
ncbi:hypothetical protein BKK49_07085 [Rodentibacter rarus]|uniref:hypothetical protein n=1 Tax=Rodentibacter rarus TaxID=1908260 RepID=UPI000987385E|nr:hypothetical protein [Rodentibacter rarus]OOF39882.1 hypothetical protein BKK49_07085 [Rodentibacter rarus]